MQELFLNTAVSIGNSLCRDALHHNNQCNWIGCENDINKEKAIPYYAALNSSWYSGTAGIAWFLSQLYSVTGDKRHKITALCAIEQALQNIDKVRLGKLGFHTGLSGIAFSAIEVGERLRKDRCIEQGFRLLQSLNQVSESEYTLDIIDGCAGAIPAIIRLNRKYNDSTLKKLLQKMGKYLLKKAQWENTVCSWNTMPQRSVANLTGYAHGAAGIASALLELYNYSKDKEYQEAAFAGFAYEDSCFNQEQENWPDFRYNNSISNDEITSYPSGCAWCHGAPGIGLSRFRAYELTQNENFKLYGQKAVSTTLRYFSLKLLGNYSLCHGVFGNADLLLFAAKRNRDKSLTKKVREIAIEAVEKYELRKIPFPNGTQSDLNSPNLMLGMAGIGYGFLRLTDPKKFKSILLIY